MLLARSHVATHGMSSNGLSLAARMYVRPSAPKADRAPKSFAKISGSTPSRMPPARSTVQRKLVYPSMRSPAL
jgi:hypothetical protein